MPRLLLLLALSCCFSGCSYLTTFYVLNDTDTAIEVEWKCEIPHAIFVAQPGITGFKRKAKRYKVNPLSTINYSEERKTFIEPFREILQPGEALLIGSDINFTLQYERSKEEVNDGFEYMAARTLNGGEELFYAEALYDKLEQPGISQCYLVIK